MRKTRYIGWALCMAVGLLGGVNVAAQMSCGIGQELLPFFPSVHMEMTRGYQGFVRLVNYRHQGWVEVVARTDEGDEGSIDVQIPANSSVHFNSRDLEQGNPSKGIYYGGIDEMDAKTTGPWSLCINRRNHLEVEATSYVRSNDGFLTETTLTVQGRYLPTERCIKSESSEKNMCAWWVIPMFNPGYNGNQVSRLRILNDTEKPKIVEIRGTRSDGTNTYCEDQTFKTRVLFSLGAWEGVNLESVELEEGDGLSSKLDPVDVQGVPQPRGKIGRARGKWLIEVFAVADSPEELVVMNLLRAPRTCLGEDGLPFYCGSIVNLSANADDAVTRRRSYSGMRMPRPIGRDYPGANEEYCPRPPMDP